MILVYRRLIVIPAWAARPVTFTDDLVSVPSFKSESVNSPSFTKQKARVVSPRATVVK